MSTIQNLKNFIRHGKQARAAGNPAFADPTTNVSTVHAHPQQPHQQQARHHQQQQPPQPQGVHLDHHAISDPHDGYAARAPAAGHRAGDFTVAGGADHRNVAAQAGAVAAQAQGEHQRLHDGEGKNRGKAYDPTVLERMVAEERESKGKFPKYPGLERWILLEKMGDGAFSNVYRARDSTGQMNEVAIKVVRKFEMNSTQNNDHLHPDFRKQPKAAERANILKEVQIMRQLDHPNIVKLVEFSESRQYYYIVLELCPGGELFHQIVRLTYFSEDLSRHVIVQVAEALEYLHEEKGVVHRDIKPENLLFYPIPFIPSKNSRPRSAEEEDKEDEGEFIKGVGSGGIGTIKIADFGLSKVVWESQTMTPCGTVGYTAPEIVKDERYSKSVDMWALGCVLYTLLCGFPPFYDESIQVLTEKVARGQYTFLSPWWDDISKQAQDLVSHLLTVDPDKRYTIREFLNHPWIRQTDEATTAAADAPPLATPAWQRQSQLGSQLPNVNDPAGTPLASMATQFLETPMGGVSRRMDFRSPGAVNLREVFDVSYAVHRQEEEAKRRKNFGQGYRGAAGVAGLNALDEAEDDEEAEQGMDARMTTQQPAGQQQGQQPPYPPPSKLPKAKDADVHQVEQSLRRTNLGGTTTVQARQQQPPPVQQQPQARGYGQHSPAVAAAAKQQVRQKQAAGPFELSLDNATLLGRRGEKKHDPSKLREQVV